MKGGVDGTNNERLGLKTSSGVVEVCDPALNRDAVRGNFGTASKCQFIHPLRCVRYHRMCFKERAVCINLVYNSP